MRDRHLEGCQIYPGANVVKTHCSGCQARLNGHVHVYREVKQRLDAKGKPYEWVSVPEYLCPDCCRDPRCVAERAAKAVD